jgi:hypothetical protein
MLRSTVSGLLIISLLPAPGRSTSIPFSVKETAGLRRFSYPVEATLSVPQPLVEADRFRLADERGNPVAAQFSRTGSQQFTVDFNLSIGPNESRKFALHYGPDVEPGPSPKGGMKVETTDKEYLLRHGGLTFAAPKDLVGLLRSVQDAKGNDWLRPTSPGLIIWYKDDIPFRAGGFGARGAPTQATVTRSGPLAVSIRYEGSEALRGNREVASRVDLTWPSSKSWVRVDWAVEDPDGLVAGLGAELHLSLGDGPTLVDFGADDVVYTVLKEGDWAKLSSHWAESTPKDGDAFHLAEWRVMTGSANSSATLARGTMLPAKGWAHIMDRRRCTALAVREFGRSGVHGAISARWNGGLELSQRFAADGQAPGPGTKKLTFWLHFVGMPVQVGALTSPQSMQAPLEVTVNTGARK